MAANISLSFPDGTEVELKDSISIGRDTPNDVVLESSAISRDHAAVTHQDGRWYLEDRGSFNGTYLNGTRVVPGTPLPAPPRRPDRHRTETLIFRGPRRSTTPYDRSARRGDRSR
jgi:pSer/pThr/pTyr-binding forkhead associated (FHA) protein